MNITPAALIPSFYPAADAAMNFLAVTQKVASSCSLSHLTLCIPCICHTHKTHTHTWGIISMVTQDGTVRVAYQLTPSLSLFSLLPSSTTIPSHTQIGMLQLILFIAKCHQISKHVICKLIKDTVSSR